MSQLKVTQVRTSAGTPYASRTKRLGIPAST